jgi:hypothetical protein
MVSGAASSSRCPSSSWCRFLVLMPASAAGQLVPVVGPVPVLPGRCASSSSWCPRRRAPR